MYVGMYNAKGIYQTIRTIVYFFSPINKNYKMKNISRFATMFPQLMTYTVTENYHGPTWIILQVAKPPL